MNKISLSAFDLVTEKLNERTLSNGQVLAMTATLAQSCRVVGDNALGGSFATLACAFGKALEQSNQAIPGLPPVPAIPQVMVNIDDGAFKVITNKINNFSIGYDDGMGMGETLKTIGKVLAPTELGARFTDIGEKVIRAVENAGMQRMVSGMN